MTDQLLIPRVGVGVIVAYPPLPPRSHPWTPRFAWLLRQGASHGNDQWSLPGGRLEFNERLIDCAKREVGEELGILRFRTFEQLSFITEDFFPEENMHWITHYFLACPADGEVTRLMEPDKAASLIIASGPPGDVFVGATEAIEWAMDHIMDSLAVFFGYRKPA